jgi:ATP-dependent Clp protease ATP-binding subunit ClpB
LTDNKGRLANFKNALIIMTSNMGSDKILENFEDLESLGEKHRADVIATTKVEVLDLLKDILRPEFLNRIDDTIMFLPLKKTEVHLILNLLVKDLNLLLKKQELYVFLTDKALDHLTTVGYDPQFGARPMKRVLQKEVVNELSKQILAGKYQKGDKILVDANAKGLTFTNS